MEEDPRRSPERAMSRGFTTGMGAIDRAANGTGFSAADEGRQDLQTSAQTGYGRRGNAAQSPLQRHIAFLTRQADPLTPVKEAPTAAATATATAPPVHSAMSRSDSNNSLTLGGSSSYADRSITASASKILPPISEDMLGGVAAMPAAAPVASNAENAVYGSSKASMSRQESNYSLADLVSMKGGSTPAKHGTSQGGNRLSKLMGGVGRRKASHS